jgi:hypothetical protein
MSDTPSTRWRGFPFAIAQMVDRSGDWALLT